MYIKASLCLSSVLLLKEGRWQWTNGDRFTYTNWHSGNPDNYHRQQRCLVMNYGGKPQEELLPWMTMPSQMAQFLMTGSLL